MIKMNKRPWTLEEVALLERAYTIGLATKKIAERLNRTDRAVRGKAHLLELSHAARQRQLYTEAEDNFVKKNALSMTRAAIAKQLGRSEGSINQRGIRLGVGFQHESKNAIYDKAHDFFETPTLENSYVAGLIAADGWLRPMSSGKVINQVGIALKRSDKHLLEYIRTVTGYTGDIRDFYAFVDGKAYPNSELRISGVPQWLADLKTYWNLTPNKTYTLQPPNEEYLTHEQVLAFHVGLIEGDGYIRFNKGTLTVSMVTASEKFADWISDSWERIVGAKPSRELHQNGKAHYIIFHGKNARSLCSQLMAINVHRLMRKWDIAKAEIARLG